MLGNDAKPQTFEASGSYGSYSITAPKNWSVQKGELVEGAQLELGNKVKEQYLVVVREDKQDVSMTFDEYAAAVRQNTEAALKNPQVGEPTDETIDGNKAVCLPISGTVEALNIQYWIYTVDYDDAYIRIITWTLQSKAEESRQIFRNAAVSLHIEPIQSGV